MCHGFPSLHDGVRPCIIILKQHFAQVLVRLNTFETLPNFFSVMTYASELIVISLCITSRRLTPSLSLNSVTHHLSFSDSLSSQYVVLLSFPHALRNLCSADQRAVH